MTTKRRLALLSSLAATPAFAAPFLAIGDNAELYLTARTEARYEDNVTFASGSADEKKIDDTVFEFVPGAQILFGKSSLTTGSLTFFERFVRYVEEDQFDDELANLSFRSKYEGAKLTLVADASYKQLNQNSGDENAPDTLVRRDITDVGGAGEYAATEKSKIGLGARYNKTKYKDQDLGTDREVYIVPINYYFAITPKVDLSAGVQYTINDIHGETNQDSEQFYYNVGARGDFTGKLSGSFSVGYSTRKPDADDADDDSTIGLRAGLLYLYSLKTQFTLDLSNDFASASTGGGQEVSSINFGVKSNIAPSFTANASLGYKWIDYLASDREDDYLTGQLGFTYTVNQYMSVDVYYTYLDNSSDDPDAEFEANIFSVAANFRY